LRDTAFFSTFHTGFPTPQAPLLLHVALNRPGDSVRMDMLRTMSHLGVKAGDHMLPPDHVAIVCEVLASAIVADEPVIVSEICRRYLAPWCDAAILRLKETDTGLANVVVGFRDFIGELCERAAPLRMAAPAMDTDVELANDR
jgi:hypothetical protein